MFGMISARPDLLRDASTATEQMAGDLRRSADALREALEAFRGTEGWWDHLPDIPPLDVDVGVATERVATTSEWLAQVAAAFEAADLTDAGGVVVAPALLINARTGDLRPADEVLVQDGDRWILNGTDGNDHIEVVEVLGVTFVRVSTWDDAAQTLVPGDLMPLTEDQADNLVIRSGDGNDVISIHANVTVDLVIYNQSGEPLINGGGENPLTSFAGGGNLQIFMGPDDGMAMLGDGDDTVYAGGGETFIDAGLGDDTIIGGDGFTTIYGNDGDNSIFGGMGTSYIAVMDGNNTIDGGLGDAIISVGTGDNTIDTGGGENVVIGSSGDDLRFGEHDVMRRITVEATTPGHAAIDLPQPEWMSDRDYERWLTRMDADLRTLSHLPNGRVGLEALDQAYEDTGVQIVVMPYGTPDQVGQRLGDPPNAPFDTVTHWLGGADPNVHGHIPQGVDAVPGSFASAPGGRTDDAFVYYGTNHLSTSVDARPPIASLYHELAHSFDQMHGGTADGDYTEVIVDANGNVVHSNGRPMAEINAVGFDITGDGQIDTLPTGNNMDGVEHPWQLTENALRDDLEWDRRPTYGRPPTGKQDVEIRDVPLEDDE